MYRTRSVNPPNRKRSPTEEWQSPKNERNLQQKTKGNFILSIPKDVYRKTLGDLLEKDGYKGVELNELKSEKNFAYIHQNLDNTKSVSRILYGLSCILKNDVIIEDLCSSLLSKTSLASSESLSQILPESYQLANFRYNGGVWIMKIDRKYSCSGKDNYIIYNKSSFERAKNEAWKAKNDTNKKNYLRGVVINRYISNPFLFNGKKTHFRAYILLRTVGGHVISDFSVMYTGSNEYVERDYENKGVHDTHLIHTSSVEIFDKERNSFIADAIQHVCTLLVREISKRRILPYPESKKGYKIIAPDIIVTDDYKPYLLEVNTDPGFGLSKLPGAEEYYRRLATWEYEHGIKPLLQ